MDRKARTNGPPSSHQVDISGVISLTLEVVTLLSNTLPLLVIFGIKKRRYRTLADFLIGVLAINDLLAVGLPLTVSLPSFLAKTWVGGRSSCWAYQVTTIFFQVSSMLLVTVMSIDRYLALFTPMFHRFVMQGSPWARTLIIGLLYSFSLIASCLSLVGSSVASEEIPNCPLWLNMSSEKRLHAYILFLTCLGYVTCIIVFLCNLAVLFKIRKLKRRFKTQNVNVQAQSNLLDKNALISFAKLICVIGLLFYLTWTPVLVVLTLKLCNIEVSELAKLYALTSLTINSLLHPVAIGIFSRQFGAGYKKIFCCFCSCIERHVSGDSRLS